MPLHEVMRHRYGFCSFVQMVWSTRDREYRTMLVLTPKRTCRMDSQSASCKTYC